MSRDQFITEVLPEFLQQITPVFETSPATYTQGGWEGWVQVELTKYLYNNYPKIEVCREFPLYGNSKRVDLFINKSLAVEIKCQSIYNGEKILEGVEKDCEKMQSLNGNVEKIVIFFLIDRNSINPVIHGLRGKHIDVRESDSTDWCGTYYCLI